MKDNDWFNPDFEPYDAIRQLGRNQEDIYNRVFQTNSNLIQLHQQVNALEHSTHKLVNIMERIIQDIKELKNID